MDIPFTIEHFHGVLRDENTALWLAQWFMPTMIFDGRITFSSLFRFNDTGLITSMRAESRGASVGKDGVMVTLPWDCGLSNYQSQDGMLIPMAGEAAWVRPEGRKMYFVGRVKKLQHEFLP